MIDLHLIFFDNFHIPILMLIELQLKYKIDLIIILLIIIIMNDIMKFYVIKLV